MKRPLTFWLVTLSVLWFSAIPVPAQEATLPSDLIREALQRNRDFLAARQRLSEMQALLRQAGVRPTPTLEVQGATGRPLGTVGEEEYSAGYFQPIETAGKRGKRIHVAQISLELAQAEVDERQRQLAFDVNSRYAEAAAAQQRLATIDQLILVNREHYRLTEARVREGDAPLLEQQLFATEMSRAEAQRAVFTGRSAGTLLELKKTVGLAPSDSLPALRLVEGATGALSLEELQQRALRSRPDLRMARILEQQARAEAELAKAEGRPDLTASARYSRRYSQFDQLGFDRAGGLVPLRDRDDVLAFGISIPLFTARRTQGTVDAALSRETAARLRSEFLIQAIPLEVEAAYRRWAAARQSVEMYRSGVIGQSEKNLAVMREAYTLGQLRILDVLNEQRRLLDTRLSYVDALSEQAQAYAELERAVGGSLQ